MGLGAYLRHSCFRRLLVSGMLLLGTNACSDDVVTCVDNGKEHPAGEIFDSGVQCCGCRSDGTIECEELFCPECLALLPGETFERAPDCTCTCGAPDGPVCEGLGCVPPEWTCDPHDWNGGVGNGCQCLCGSGDPDCEIPGELVEGCANADDACSFSGLYCVTAAWLCGGGGVYDLYGDGRCDCGCGAQDVDCPDLLAQSCEDCYNGCSSSECPGTISPDNNAACD